MKNDCKCKDCKRRKVGCHSTCVDYKRYRMELDKINKKIKMQKDMDSLLKR